MNGTPQLMKGTSQLTNGNMIYSPKKKFIDYFSQNLKTISSIHSSSPFPTHFEAKQAA